MLASRWDRLGPLSGVLFVVLVVVGNLLPGEPPDFLDDPDTIAAFYVDNAGEIMLGMSLALISLLFLVWFLARLRHRLAADEDGQGQFNVVAFGGGLVATSMLAAGFSLNALGALRADEDGELSADLAVVFSDGSSVLMGLAGPIGMAVLLAAFAVVVLRFRGFPAWFGWLSALMALVGLVPPVSWTLLLAFPVWVLIASILLYRREGQADTSPGAIADAPPHQRVTGTAETV